MQSPCLGTSFHAVDGVVSGVQALAAPLAGSVVTIGAFDGVHRGHQALLTRAADLARAEGVPAVAFTFHPHPAKVLAPARAPALIVSVEERARLLLAHGMDQVVVQPFDEAFARVSADAFVRDFLAGPLRPRHVVVGFNFAYGQGRAGNRATLEAAGHELGFGVDVVGPVDVGGVVCSSTRVRERLLEGDVGGAARLLGRAPFLTGQVVPGDQRGRTIGFPTANVDPEPELLPCAGVYATRVSWDGQPALPSVTNIGNRPTFGGGHVTVEVHLLDFSGDLYGRRLRVELVGRLRDERRFDGRAALVAQLNQDVASARAVLEAR